MWKFFFFFLITEKVQDSQLCCSFWSAVRKGRKTFSLLFQGRRNFVWKKLQTVKCFSLIYNLFFFFFKFTDVLVNAVARSSSIWTRHKLHPHDSCQWPCRVIIISRLELLMWIGMPLRDDSSTWPWFCYGFQAETRDPQSADPCFTAWFCLIHCCAQCFFLEFFKTSFSSNPDQSTYSQSMTPRTP